MSPMSAPIGRGAAALALLLALASVGIVHPGGARAATAPIASPKAGPATSASALTLRDRILAVVDEDPILLSDVDRAIALGFVERNPGESDTDLQRRTLDQLIDQRVRLHEVSRFGIEQVPVDQIEQQVQLIRSRFPGEEVFRDHLAEVGLDLQDLRQLVARQLSVWIYFEEFLGPRVFVSLEDIRKYYEETLVPEARARGATPPPIEDVREDIRNLLKQQRLNQAIEQRTEELRREADIVTYFDSEHDHLPPVVLDIEGTARAPESKPPGR